MGPERAAGLGGKNKPSGIGLKLPLFNCCFASLSFPLRGVFACLYVLMYMHLASHAFTRCCACSLQSPPHAGRPGCAEAPVPHQKAVVLGVGSQAEAKAHVVLPLGDVGERYPSFGERMRLGTAAGHPAHVPVVLPGRNPSEQL
uniref:Uncharacterized protein n=1 Tax=Athene cunicularia TaxID=194338 RepID=A0A663MY05_ATHCN